MVLIGATCDYPYANLQPAYPLFESLGITLDSADFNAPGLLAFVAQKGAPQKTVYIARTPGNTDLYLNVAVQGNVKCILYFEWYIVL